MYFFVFYCACHQYQGFCKIILSKINVMQSFSVITVPIHCNTCTFPLCIWTLPAAAMYLISPVLWQNASQLCLLPPRATVLPAILFFHSPLEGCGRWFIEHVQLVSVYQHRAECHKCVGTVGQNPIRNKVVMTDMGISQLSQKKKEMLRKSSSPSKRVLCRGPVLEDFQSNYHGGWAAQHQIPGKEAVKHKMFRAVRPAHSATGLL